MAAVIAYGLGKETEHQLVLVVDLGGGTYDVSLVECFEGRGTSSPSRRYGDNRLHVRGILIRACIPSVTLCL